MQLTVYPFTATDTTGLQILEPVAPVAPMLTYRADKLALGPLASWPSAQGTGPLEVIGTVNVVSVDGVQAVRGDGTSGRLNSNTSPLWRTVVAVIKLDTTTTGGDWLFGANAAHNPLVIWDAGRGILSALNGTPVALEIATSPGWHVIAYTIGPGGAASLTVDDTRITATLGTEGPVLGMRLMGHWQNGQHSTSPQAALFEWSELLDAAQLAETVDYVRALYPTIL